MAFGQHPSKPTIVPAQGGAKPESDDRKVISYVPNPKMARLWNGFPDFLVRKGYTFTSSQMEFAKLFFTGANVLLSGEAGTGKSYLIKALFEYLYLHQVAIAKTASTGIAAFSIGGQTLHSFMGVGLAQEDTQTLISKVLKNGKAKARIRAMEVLFIDEISMCKGEFLNKIDTILRIVRGKNEPFGGVQMCCCGDFLQLLPVFKGDEIQELAFTCESWCSADIQTVLLREQMRQKEDNVLGRVLSDLRVGDTSSIHLLDGRIGAKFPDDGIEAVRIFCKNVDVDEYNRSRLAQINSPVKTFKARDIGLPYHTDSFNKNCPAPQILDLKVGAQVSLLVNLDVDYGLVNGSVGIVKSLGVEGVKVQFIKSTVMISKHEWEIKEQEVGVDGKMKTKVVATRSQLPLKLAWAQTTHRSQGQTLDRVIVDIADAFAAAMCYVALSRVRNLESLSIAGKIPERAIRVNPECVRFYEELQSGNGKDREDLAF